MSALFDKTSAIVSGSDFTVPTVTLNVSKVIGGSSVNCTGLVTCGLMFMALLMATLFSVAILM